MSKKYAKLMYIEWEDHYSPNTTGWQTGDEVNGAIGTCVNSSIGWVVAEDKKHIRLASQVGDIFCDESSVFDGVVTIIKSCITKKKVLRGYTAKRAR